MSRRTAREAIMSLFYEYSITNNIGVETLGEMNDIFSSFNLNEENYKYIKNLLNLLSAHQDEIDEKIKNASESWSMDRISKVDLAVLRLATAEILYTDTPKNIICNEAVEITKKYSTDKSYSFVNGILGNIKK